MVISKIDDGMPSRKRGSCNNDDDDSVKPTDIPDALDSVDTGDSTSSGSNIDRKRKVACRLHRKLEKTVAKAADNDSDSDESDNEEPQMRKMKPQPALTTNAVKQNNKATPKESSSNGESSEESSDDEATKTHMAKQTMQVSKKVSESGEESEEEDSSEEEQPSKTMKKNAISDLQPLLIRYFGDNGDEAAIILDTPNDGKSREKKLNEKTLQAAAEDVETMQHTFVYLQKVMDVGRYNELVRHLETNVQDRLHFYHCLTEVEKITWADEHFGLCRRG